VRFSELSSCIVLFCRDIVCVCVRNQFAIAIAFERPAVIVNSRQRPLRDRFTVGVNDNYPRASGVMNRRRIRVSANDREISNCIVVLRLTVGYLKTDVRRVICTIVWKKHEGFYYTIYHRITGVLLIIIFK